MTHDRDPEAASPGTGARTKRTLVLLSLVALVPIALAVYAYFFQPRAARTNYGELIAAPAPDLGGTLDGGNAFDLASIRGRWVMYVASSGACPSTCESALYAMRQARTIQNADAERVVRVWWITDDDAPPNAVVATHPGLIIVRASAGTLQALAAGGDRIRLVDPRGNLVLAWPADPDIKAMAQDLKKLLRASQIG